MELLVNKFNYCGLPQLALVLVAFLSLELQAQLQNSASERLRLESELHQIYQTLPADEVRTLDVPPVGRALADQSTHGIRGS